MASVYQTAFDEELRNRLQKEHETEESLRKRLEKQNYELSFINHFDQVIVNDDLETVNKTILSNNFDIYKNKNIKI